MNGRAGNCIPYKRTVWAHNMVAITILEPTGHVEAVYGCIWLYMAVNMVIQCGIIIIINIITNMHGNGCIYIIQLIT